MTKSYPSEWFETSSGIYFVVADAVQFYDDFDHWRNGFCRLLEIEPEEAKILIARCVSSGDKLFSLLTLAQKTDAIKHGARDHFKRVVREGRLLFSQCGTAFDGTPADALCASSISGNIDRLIVGNGKLQYAWQIDAKTLEPVKADSVIYDEAYFDTPEVSHLGMRDYSSNAEWRLEKSRRLLRTILKKSATDPNVMGGTVLDIGSGGGYLRKAAQEFQLKHFGLDSSESAIKICQEKFGFETAQGTIADLPALLPDLHGKCDFITLFDVIEHLDDPLGSIKVLRQFLSPTGCIVVRTPNLVSLEYDILGDYFYSFKLDHIHYFSPFSLNHLMAISGLQPIYLETTSHLFKGLLGMDFTHQCGKGNIGADILALYKAS